MSISKSHPVIICLHILCHVRAAAEQGSNKALRAYPVAPVFAIYGQNDIASTHVR